MLRDVRVSKDISQKTLAELAGVSLPVVVRMENGKTVMRESFLKVCQALGIEPDQIEGVVLHSAVLARNRGKLQRQ